MWTGEIYTNMLRVARVLFRKRREKFSVFILAGTNVTIALHLIKPENVRRAMKKGKKNVTKFGIQIF